MTGSGTITRATGRDNGFISEIPLLTMPRKRSPLALALSSEMRAPRPRIRVDVFDVAIVGAGSAGCALARASCGTWPTTHTPWERAGWGRRPAASWMIGGLEPPGQARDRPAQRVDADGLAELGVEAGVQGMRARMPP